MHGSSMRSAAVWVLCSAPREMLACVVDGRHARTPCPPRGTPRVSCAWRQNVQRVFNMWRRVSISEHESCFLGICLPCYPFHHRKPSVPPPPLSSQVVAGMFLPVRALMAPKPCHAHPLFKRHDDACFSDRPERAPPPRPPPRSWPRSAGRRHWAVGTLPRCFGARETQIGPNNLVLFLRQGRSLLRPVLIPGTAFAGGRTGPRDGFAHALLGQGRAHGGKRGGGGGSGIGELAVE